MSHARGVILGGGDKPKANLEILVPRGYEDAPPERIGRCLVCGQRFYRGEEANYIRHAGPCARKNIDKLQEQRAQEKASIFAPWDPEVNEHLLGVGRTMRAEGRMTMKPSERAGL